MIHSTESSRFFHPLLTPVLSLMLLSLAVVGCGDTKGPAKGPDSAAAKNGASVAGGDTAAGAVGEFAEGESVDPQASYTIRLTPKPGDVYSYRLTMKGSTELQGVKATEETIYNFTQRVTGVNTDGSFTIEMRYDSVRSSRTFPPGVVDTSKVARTITYDTRKKIDSNFAEAKQAKALIGQKVNITLSKSGEVLEVSNLEPVLSAMLGKLRDSVDPRAVEQFRAGLKMSAFQGVLQQVFLQGLPDTAIHVASTWTRRDSMPVVIAGAAIPSRASVTYTMTEVKKVEGAPMGRISIALETTFPKKKLEDKTVSATIDDASATGSGDVLLNLATGFPVRKSTRIDVRLKLTGKAKVGPDTGKSSTISQGQSTITLVELLDYKAGEE